MPLQPVFEICPFIKWTLDFIGPVNFLSSIGHTFILTNNNYYMRWTEEKTFRNCKAKMVTKFMEEHNFTRFGMSFSLVCNNGLAFVSIFLTQWTLEN